MKTKTINELHEQAQRQTEQLINTMWELGHSANPLPLRTRKTVHHAIDEITKCRSVLIKIKLP